MGKKQIINNITFSSMSELKKYVRETIIPYGKKECISATTNSNHFNFLIDLLKKHERYEEKKGKGEIKNLKQAFFDYGNKMICTWDDGTETAVSWRKCLGRKKGSVNNKFDSAMRMSVRDQTFSFKKNMWEDNYYLICNICKTKTEEENEVFSNKWHVDHSIAFDKLKKRFLKKTSHKKPIEFKDYGKGHTYKYSKTFKNENDPFVKEWIKFHKENATYQILCNCCNCSKGSK